MTEFEERRKAFGERLRALRARAGLSGRDFAAALGTGQPKISKIETGRQTPTDDDVVAWCDALRVAPETLRELLDELADLRVQQVTWQQQLRSGHRTRQTEIGTEEEAAAVIRCVDVMAVPGLVQTPAYARKIFETQTDLHDAGRDIDEAVRARVQRQQILYESGRQIEVLITESALHHPVCSPADMAGQIDRLISVVGLPGVRFGVIPRGRVMPFVLTHGFVVLDDVVLADTMTSELRIDDPEQVALYHRVVDALWTVADEGPASIAVLKNAATALSDE